MLNQSGNRVSAENGISRSRFEVSGFRFATAKKHRIELQDPKPTTLMARQKTEAKCTKRCSSRKWNKFTWAPTRVPLPRFRSHSEWSLFCFSLATSLPPFFEGWGRQKINMPPNSDATYGLRCRRSLSSVAAATTATKTEGAREKCNSIKKWTS